MKRNVLRLAALLLLGGCYDFNALEKACTVENGCIRAGGGGETKPPPPTAVVATAGIRQATVTWTPPVNPGGSPITRYRVVSNPGALGPEVDASVTSADVTGLANGTTYTFTVQSVNELGAGEPSAPSLPVTTAAVPGAPLMVTGSPGDQQIIVNWVPPADPGTGQITGYVVTSAEGGGLTPQRTTATTATFTGLMNGTPYTFTVVAENQVGPGPASAPSTAVTPQPPPVAPVATASQGTSPLHVSVSWGAVATATGYKVFRDGVQVGGLVTGLSFDDTSATAGGAPASPVLSASDGTDTTLVALTWTVSVPNGPTHSYTVRAVNGTGDSPPSLPVVGFRGALPVTSSEVSFNAGTSWQAAGPSSFDDLTAPAGTVVGGTASATDATSLGVVSLSLSGASSAPGATRTYLVRALNASGTGPSSNADQGFRGVGPLTYAWQRTNADSASGTAASLPGLTTPTAVDLTAPADGSGRWYSCLVSAAGAMAQSSTADRGNVLLPPAAPKTNGWVTDGVVNAVANANGLTYVGGTFTALGHHVGGFAAFANATSTLPSTGRAVVDRSVFAMADDGAGGWFIGGDFTSVDGVPRNRLAHVTSAGVLDATFNPNADGDVLALAVSGGVLYLGGAFTNLGGMARNRLAAVSTTTGAVTSWNPNADATVRTLQIQVSTIYFGGDFLSVGGVTRNRLAAVDTAGALTTWAPSVNAPVRVLNVEGGMIYAGGAFTQAGVFNHAHLVAIDAYGAIDNSFSADVDGEVFTLDYDFGTLYVGGSFTTIGGSPHANCGAVNALSNGQTLNFRCDMNGTVRANVSWIPASAGRCFAGDFTTVDFGAGAFAATGLICTGVVAWRPSPLGLGKVFALGQAGTSLFVAGSFLGFNEAARSRLAAFDSSGALASWAPAADDTVSSLATFGSTVYAGGDFTTVGGTSRPRLAAINGSSGALLGWNTAGADGTVSALAVSNGNVYAGGNFVNVGGVARTRLAALPVTSGVPTSWNPGADAPVYALAIDAAGTAYVGGDFSFAGGLSRNRLAALSTSGTGSALPWNPDVSGATSSVRALAVGPSTVYAGGTFATVGGLARPRVAAIDTSTGAPSAWSPQPDGDVTALALTGNTLYVGGQFSTFAAQSRRGLVAVDAAGAFTPWTPNANGPVQALATTQTALYVGGSFSVIGGRACANYAVFGP